VPSPRRDSAVASKVIPSTKLQTRVVSVCMGYGHPAAQLLQLLRVVSVECVRDAVTVLPAAQ